MVFDEDGIGEYAAEHAGYAYLTKAGMDLAGANIAAVAGNIAVAGEGVDGGAWAAKIGCFAGSVLAALQA